MSKKHLLTLTVLFFSLLGHHVNAQLADSPFSAQGFGKFHRQEFIQHTSMGGLGIGTGTYWNLNIINPAMLLYSRNTLLGQLTSFQAATAHESIDIQNTTEAQLGQNTELAYLGMGFPIIPNRWFTSFGLLPFTSSSSSINYQREIANSGTSSQYFEEVSGGLNTVYFSNGVAITDNINVGLTANFIFGSRNKEINNSVILDENVVYNPNNPVIAGFSSQVFQRSSTNAINLKGGISYSDSIRVSSNEPIRITVGAIYEFGNDAESELFESIRRTSSSGDVTSSDTLRVGETALTQFPSGIGMGFSLSKGVNWTVGIDAGMRNFQGLKVFGQEQNYINSTYIKVGGEVTPDASNAERYLSRVSYRMGGSFEKMPYLVNGAEINDFGINFGVSLPIVPSAGQNGSSPKGFSSVDMSFTYGVQGNLETNQFSEEYFRFNFGVTFNDRWFVRRKFN